MGLMAMSRLNTWDVSIEGYSRRRFDYGTINRNPTPWALSIRPESSIRSWSRFRVWARRHPLWKLPRVTYVVTDNVTVTAVRYIRKLNEKWKKLINLENL